jgi:FMN phosphatase YigB (HAD superfamily)
MTAEAAEVAFLFDVDNTLFDNDRFQEDLRDELTRSFGDATCRRYWAIFEELRQALGYADYLGALQGLRRENLREPKLPAMANWLLDYPFADHLYPGALEAVAHIRQWGAAAILSDGDAVFQPHKIERSGLWRAFDGQVMIYVHKELELDDVARRRPASRYVLIDDKLRILDAVKANWGDKVVTVFPKQGHYALDPAIVDLPRPDIEIADIADLLKFDAAAFKRA